MAEPRKVFFYYLTAFANTGGIQKFNCSFIKGLNELADERFFETRIVSVYDRACDKRYVQPGRFKGYRGSRIASLMSLLQSCRSIDTLILGHINLSVAGVLIKIVSPNCRLVVIAHGVEVWRKQGFLARYCLKSADIILSVSNYTSRKILKRVRIDSKKIRAFPNTIDPFFKFPSTFSKPVYLLNRYGITDCQQVIFTMARLKESEISKGYDKVIKAMPAVLEKYPQAVYLLAGKTDTSESDRLKQLISANHLSNHVIMPGYIDSKEIEDHYQLADVFIMPSVKEGFGIVYIESLACGTPVIGGNADGTVDALQNGEIGQLVDPENSEMISGAILKQLSGKAFSDKHFLQQKVEDLYGFDKFKKRLAAVLS